MTFEPKVTKVVTRPVLKFEKEKPLYVRILSAFFAGAVPPKRAGALRDPVAPTLVNVFDLTEKTEASLPVHATLKATFDSSYPDNAYVGKCFAITSKTRQTGRQFTPYHLVEIEDPDAKKEETGTAAGEAPTPVHAAAGGRRR